MNNKLNLPLAAKKQVLVWSDCVFASTGFGTVANQVCKALYSTGRYEIDQLAINFTGTFYDKKEYPYNILSSRLGDPQDLYGNQMFIDALQKKNYDYVLIINDTFVVEELAKKMNELVSWKVQKGYKVPNLVYYFPVDCRVLPQYTTMIKESDCAVAYTQFGADMAEAVGCKVHKIIYHGAEVDFFTPMSTMERAIARKRYLNASDDTFVIVNVNRNTVRKDLAQTIYVFSEFKKNVPNSVLYLHAKIEDYAGGRASVNLAVVVEELGLDIHKDVLFPSNFNPGTGFPKPILRELYNCGDVFLTTHLGEGWGLTLTEAMACGVPVIAPTNTSMPEIIGTDRGYLYPCEEMVYVDNSGLRPRGRAEDILLTLNLAYKEWLEDKKGLNNLRKNTIARARQFTIENSWTNIGKKWIKLFDELPVKDMSNVKLKGESI